MSAEEFDASLVHSDPVGEEVLAMQTRMVEQLMARPNALANAKLHAENELHRLVVACNRVAWRSMPAEARPPSADEVNALLEGLEQENRHKLMHDAKLAAEQRFLVVKLQEAHERCQAELAAEQQEHALQEQLAQEWAEFEAYDAQGKEARFETWRASRANQ
ncbi:MAG: hypothetical protein KTR19_05735 [Hyphomicrobiales bacterium]|nr:hypothetical protein [Hyphomicrobiales bacterium]